MSVKKYLAVVAVAVVVAAGAAVGANAGTGAAPAGTSGGQVQADYGWDQGPSPIASPIHG